MARKQRSISDYAAVCHEANKAYCEYVLGDDSQSSWKDAPEWQKVSAINGVVAVFQGSRGPEAQHESWMKEKIKDGWIYGETKDAEKKTHPCLVSYKKLPPEQKVKDILFFAIANSFNGVLVDVNMFLSGVDWMPTDLPPAK